MADLQRTDNDIAGQPRNPRWGGGGVGDQQCDGGGSLQYAAVFSSSSYTS